MPKDFIGYRPDQFPQEVTLSGTANTMTRVDLPPWMRRIVLTPRTNAAYLVSPQDGADGAVVAAAAHTTTLTADDAREKIFRDGPSRPDYENWPPSIYLASADVSVVVELEVEP